MSTVTLLPVLPTASDAPATATSPPIVQFFHLALGIFSATSSAVSVFLSSAWSLITTVLSPIGYLLSLASSPLLYLLSPVIVLCNALFVVFIHAPLSFLLGVARELYPVYSFIGATCIWAALMGLCIRWFAKYLQIAMFGSDDTSIPNEKLVSAIKQERGIKPTKKKVSIKEEADVRSIPR